MQHAECCRPSVTDEEWYSPKRPSSTVAFQHNDLYAEVSDILASMLVPGVQVTINCLEPFGS